MVSKIGGIGKIYEVNSTHVFLKNTKWCQKKVRHPWISYFLAGLLFSRKWCRNDFDTFNKIFFKGVQTYFDTLNIGI